MISIYMRMKSSVYSPSWDDDSCVLGD